MNSRPWVTILSVLACVSMALNAALWISIRSVQEDCQKLQGELTILHAATNAANAAGMVHDQLQQRAFDDVQRKNRILDQATRNARDDGLDDAEFLDALRRVFASDPHSQAAPARKPVSGLPDARDSGRTDANR